ncbi:uncharacterized protein LOC134542401 isoform X2 [Bacillus rossius redtenbacheri]|uniref:uncharacterized protein LOC134542401 isoform X2 n=1 Tax=Bacillus rossius redtenbacheri TaxID=93214 RepID=UPI002FDED725
MGNGHTRLIIVLAGASMARGVWTLLLLAVAAAVARGLPIVDPGLFVIMGVRTCGMGRGYCLLGGDCTLDEDFLPDVDGGHCDGLRSAFTPSAHFICCRYSNGSITAEPETSGTTQDPDNTTTSLALEPRGPTTHLLDFSNDLFPLGDTLRRPQNPAASSSISSHSGDGGLRPADGNEVGIATRSQENHLPSLTTSTADEYGEPTQPVEEENTIVYKPTTPTVVDYHTYITAAQDRDLTKEEMGTEVMSFTDGLTTTGESLSMTTDTVVGTTSYPATLEVRDNTTVAEGVEGATTAGPHRPTGDHQWRCSGDQRNLCWMVTFEDSRDGTTLCHGAFVGVNAVLTSAQCIVRLFSHGLEEVKLRGGSTRVSSAQIKDVLVHEDYDIEGPMDVLNDLGMVRLHSGEWSTLAPECALCLPQVEEDFMGRKCCSPAIAPPSHSAGRQLDGHAYSDCGPGESVSGPRRDAQPGAEMAGSALLCGSVLAGVASMMQGGAIFTPTTNHLPWIRANMA